MNTSAHRILRIVFTTGAASAACFFPAFQTPAFVSNLIFFSLVWLFFLALFAVVFEHKFGKWKPEHREFAERITSRNSSKVVDALDVSAALSALYLCPLAGYFVLDVVILCSCFLQLLVRFWVLPGLEEAI